MKILTAESVMPEAYTAQTDDQINWFSLGFKATPFNNSHADSNLFFKSQALIYTLNKLCTLDTSETCTTFLVGQKGCGKSTCLRALKKIRSHYHSILLIGTSGLNPQNLLKTLMSDSSHLVELSRTPSTEDCISLLKSLSAQKQQIRLLVYNADRLPKETVSLIKKLSSIQPNGSQLQFVLCAEKKKMHADIAGDAQLKTQVVQLDNLTRLETEKYLALKLQLSTDSKRCPMIPKDYIDQLYHRTQGNLFRINQDAARSLPEHLNVQETPASQPQTWEQYQRFLPLALLPLAAIAAIVTQYATNTQSQQALPRIEQVQKLTPPPPTARQVSKLLYALSQPEMKSNHP